MKKPSKLEIARRMAGISQDELAQRCGISRTTISEVETGKSSPSCYTMLAICKALGKTLNDLFWEEQL